MNRSSATSGDTINMQALYNKRKRADRRFRIYGAVGVIIALSILFILLAGIITNGIAGLIEARLHFKIDATELQNIPQSQLASYNYRKLLKNHILAEFPQLDGRKAKREITKLLSVGAAQQLRDAVLKYYPDIPDKLLVDVTASDPVNLYMKGLLKESKLSDIQKAALEILKQRNMLTIGLDYDFFLSGDSREPELAGFLASIVGSILTIIVCLVVAFPIGVMAAIYLEEFARKGWFGDVIEVNINNLAAVPSIVFGLLGLALYLGFFGLPRSSALVGGLTLALMTLPIIIIATRAALRAVPPSIRDAARALGASEIQVVLHHSLPLALPGIMTGTILGIARAIGETAPLLMIGMVAFIADVPTTITDPATVMPVQIYLWASSPEISFMEKTSSGIMVLLVILLALNLLAISLRNKFERKW